MSNIALAPPLEPFPPLSVVDMPYFMVKAYTYSINKQAPVMHYHLMPHRLVYRPHLRFIKCYPLGGIMSWPTITAR